MISPTYNTVKKTTKRVSNITLVDNSALKVDYIVSTYELNYLVNPQTKSPLRLISKKKLKQDVVKPVIYKLVEITPMQLALYRWSGTPSFVLKLMDRLYYTKIPKNLILSCSPIFGEHLCGAGCKRVSAASDEKGGCKKVRDTIKCIENYPWISTGYETFNTPDDCCVVIECSNYEKIPSFTIRSKKKSH